MPLCLCLQITGNSVQSLQPKEFLTENDVSTLKTFFDKQNAIDSREIELALMYFEEGRSAVEHFVGYVSIVTYRALSESHIYFSHGNTIFLQKKLIDVITLDGYQKVVGFSNSFGGHLAIEVENGGLDVKKITALFDE